MKNETVKEEIADNPKAIKALTAKQGHKMFPLIWTIFLSKKNDEWVNSFYSRSLRYRCLFQKKTDATWGNVIYFHLDEEEMKALGIDYSAQMIYFYGAYNQILVCQIRSFGALRAMTELEKSAFIRIIQRRNNGLDVGDKLPLKPDPEEELIIFHKIRSGYYFRFDPMEISYHAYERF